MITTLTALALVTAATGPSSNHGLVRGVDTSGLGLSEIVKLKNAADNDDRNLIRVIRDGKPVFVRVN